MDGNISMNTNNLQDDIAALFSYLKKQPNVNHYMLVSY